MARRSRPAEPGAPFIDGARDWVCLAIVGAPKGIKGAVRLTCFTEESKNITAYGPLRAGPGGRVLTVKPLENLKNNQVVVEIEGISDRDAAAALTGTRLYVHRADLPKPEDDDEFYFHDLIGLEAYHVDGRLLGTVTSVQDYGAGAFLEILPDSEPETVLVPFTRDAVPTVDLAAGRLIVDPPDEVSGDG